MMVCREDAEDDFDRRGMTSPAKADIEGDHAAEGRVEADKVGVASNDANTDRAVNSPARAPNQYHFP